GSRDQESRHHEHASNECPCHRHRHKPPCEAFSAGRPRATSSIAPASPFLPAVNTAQVTLDACAGLGHTIPMKRLLASVVVAIGVAVVSLAGQSAGSNWQVPRTPDGHPDLQGVWSNNSVTPMTRPTQWKDKTELTDAEVNELKGLVARYVSQGGDAVFGNYIQIALDMKEKNKYDQISYDPTTGNYNQFWMVDRDWDNRTSLITDPADGQMPALTAAAQARRA